MVRGGETEVHEAEEEGASSRERLPESVGGSFGPLVWNFFSHAFLMPPRYFPNARHSPGSSEGAGDTLAPSSRPLGALAGAAAVGVAFDVELGGAGGHACGVPVCECEEASDPGGELLLALPSGGTAPDFGIDGLAGGVASTGTHIEAAVEEVEEGGIGGEAPEEEGAGLRWLRASSSAPEATCERTV